MKFLKFCSGEDEDELTSSFIDYCLGCPQLITDFAEVLKNEWKIGSSAQLSYLHAISDLITLYNVCAVPWGVLSTVGGVQYRGGIS